MGTPGNLSIKRKGTDELLASMADWYTWRELDISTESGSHIVGGYLIVATKWPGLVLKAFYNQSTSADAVIIAKTESDDIEGTITVGAKGWTPKQPAIAKIKVSGTSDNILCYFQKR